MHFIKTLITIFLTALISLGCSNKFDPNEKNFKSIIGSHYEKEGSLCLGYRNSWPYEIALSERGQQQPRISQLNYLLKLGMLSVKEVEVDDHVLMSKIKVDRFSLTDRAKPFLKKIESTLSDSDIFDFCWGQLELDEIVRWVGPLKFGDFEEVSVAHTLKLSHVAEWATTQEAKDIFQSIRTTTEEVESRSEKTFILGLSALGWEVK